MTPGLPESCDSSIHQSNRNSKEGIHVVETFKTAERRERERVGGGREDREERGERRGVVDGSESEV